MERKLTRTHVVIYHYVGGERRDGAHDQNSGDVDDCGLTDDDRAAGVDISALVGVPAETDQTV